MGSAGSGRAGRLALYLFILNLLAVTVGLGMEYVLANRFPDLPEFNADKIRAWTQPENYKPAPAVLPEPDAEAGAATDVDRICLELAEPIQSHFMELQSLAAAAGVAWERCAYTFDKKLPWWVFWPPEYEAGQREKALRAIRATGQKDVLPVTQGAMAQAFSLGVFSTEGQARQQRDVLRSKGLDKVEYGPRPSAGAGRLACAIDNAGQLERLQAELPAWVKPLDPARCPEEPAAPER